MESVTLFRISGWAAILSGLCLVIDTVFIELFLPGTALTNSIGHFAVVLGLFALMGVYLWQREASGALGAVAFGVTIVGIAYLLGVMFFVNYIAPYLTPETRQLIFVGPPKVAALLSAATFELGVILFGIATARAGRFPRLAALLYTLGYTAFVVEAFVKNPGVFESVIRAGQVAGALAVIWMGRTLLAGPRSRPAVTQGVPAAPPAPLG